MLADFNLYFTFIVLALVFVAFLTEKFGSHIIAMTGMAALLATGALNANDMLQVFSNSAPITIACMFIISAALDQTGVIDLIGKLLLMLSKKNATVSIIVLVLFVVIISAFMNNTPVVIILTPVVIMLAKKMQRYPSKYLIPLSYAAIMGGTCTLIGTSTNILVSDLANEYAGIHINMFDITLPGLILASVGMIYLILFSRFLLPDRMPPKDLLDKEGKQKYFITETLIPAHSPLIGKTLNELKLTEDEDYQIIDLVRKDTGTRLQVTQPSNISKRISPLRDIPLEAGDRLVFKITKDDIPGLKQHLGVIFDPENMNIYTDLPPKKVMLSEGYINAGSSFIGKRVKDLHLRRNYNCFVVGIHHHDKNITGNIGNMVLRENDTLIFQSSAEDAQRLFTKENIINAADIRQQKLNKRSLIAIAIITGVVSLSAIGVMSIAGLAFIGAITAILTKCVTSEQSYRTIDWKILLLIFGMLGIGTAMQNTGAMAFIVNQIVPLANPYGPLVILAVVYFMTSLLTEMVTNNAVAVIMTPIVIGIASQLGYNPEPFVIAVMFGASASFATPIGYQTNTFVYAAGGYKFKDFFIIGVPMNLIMWITAVTVIPLFWPF